MPGESYHWRLGSLLLYLCHVFRALINSIVCWLSWGETTVSTASCTAAILWKNLQVHLLIFSPTSLFLRGGGGAAGAGVFSLLTRQCSTSGLVCTWRYWIVLVLVCSFFTEMTTPVSLLSVIVVFSLFSEMQYTSDIGSLFFTLKNYLFAQCRKPQLGHMFAQNKSDEDASNSSFSQTIDLPCFPFRAAVFIRLKSVCCPF